MAFGDFYLIDFQDTDSATWGLDLTGISTGTLSISVIRAALTGFVEAAAGSNATTSAEPIITYSTSSNMSAERVLTASASVALNTGVAGQISPERAALTGFAAASANSNATTSAEPIITYAASSNMSAERVATDTTTIDVDIGTAGQVRWNVQLAADYAWTGIHTFTSSSAAVPFQVNVTSGEAQFNASVFSVDASTDVLIEAGNALTLSALGDFTFIHDGGEHARLRSDDGSGGFLMQEAASDSTPLVPNGFGMWWTKLISSETFPWWTNRLDEDEPILRGQAGTTTTQTSTSTSAATVSHTMLANTNLVGTTYRLEAFVEYIKTAVNTTDPRFVIQIGGTNVAFIQIDQNANAGTHYFRVHGTFTVRSLGAAGVATYSVGLQVVGENDSAQVCESIVNTPAAGTLNTTADQTIAIGVALASTVASNSIAIHTATIERVYR